MVKVDKALQEAILSGKLTPAQAIAMHDHPSQPLHDIQFDFVQEPLACGFPTMEKYNYLRKGKPDLIIVAARPGYGKTSLVTQIAMNVAKHSNVLMYSLEMANSQLMTRMAAVHLEKGTQWLSKLTPEQQVSLQSALAQYRLRIDDTNSLDIHNLINRAKILHDKWPISLVIVDYIQIVTIPSMRSKAEEISKVAEKLKALAKELNCPVLAVAQMNRNVENRYGQTGVAKPMMSDIADSAGIEKWADLIMFLHRPGQYDKTRASEAQIFIAKNRNGEAEDFNLQFTGSMTKFFDTGI